MNADTAAVAEHRGISYGGTADDLISLGFPKETLEALGPAIVATQLVRYAPGDTIYHEETRVDALYVLRDGRIKLLNYLESGRARIVRLHNRGSIIGLNGLMEDTHTHTAVAINAVLAYQIPMHLIKIVRDEDPDTYCQLLEYSHEYLHMADTWITEFSTGAIRGRVARLIRFLVETDESRAPDQVTLLTVEEMANILGVTPESVSRTMADLKRSKILQHLGGGAAGRYQCDMKGLLREVEK